MTIALKSSADTRKSEWLKIRRHTLTASSSTNGIYRLDTTTGAIKWRRPYGTEKEGYHLIYPPEA